MDNLTIISKLLFGYILGSIPGSFIIGVLAKGVDVRQYGSGTVSGSMVWEHVGKVHAIIAGLFDLGKIVLPAWIFYSLGDPPWVYLAVGLSAVIGHCWPVFLKFHGGRGLGGLIILMFFFYPNGAWIMAAFLLIGWILGDSAPVAIAGIIFLLPAMKYQGIEGYYSYPIIMLLFTFIKRVEANRRPLPSGSKEKAVVILRRLFLDRDIMDHKVWLRQVPKSEETTSGNVIVLSED